MDGHVVEDHGIRPCHEVGVDLIGHHHVDDLIFSFGVVGIGEKFHVDPGIGVDAVDVSDDFFEVFFGDIRRQFFIVARRR